MDAPGTQSDKEEDKQKVREPFNHPLLRRRGLLAIPGVGGVLTLEREPSGATDRHADDRTDWTSHRGTRQATQSESAHGGAGHPNDIASTTTKGDARSVVVDLRCHRCSPC
jgi:hypothetical protein